MSVSLRGEVVAHLLSRTADFVGLRPLVWLGDHGDCSPRSRSVSPEEVSESPRSAPRSVRS